MRRRFMMTVAVLFLLLIGSACWAQDPTKEKALPDKMWEVLRGAAEIEVVMIDPAGQEVFVGEWKYLGKANVAGPGGRKAIVDSLQEGVKKAAKEGKGKFAPQYGVRATSGGTTVEMVIDFTSGEIRLFSGKQSATIRTSDSPKTLFAKLFEV
jgi:hypothetical protein